LLEIINHPVVTVHSPNIILITPPPFEETMLLKLLEEWGSPPPTRKAVDAQHYAELVKEVGKEAGLPVLDIWSAFMEKAGWKSKELEELLYDGEFPDFERGGSGVHHLLTRSKVYISALQDIESSLMNW
jgi:lysophospholipase L1-like esterase